MSKEKVSTRGQAWMSMWQQRGHSSEGYGIGNFPQRLGE